MHIHVLGVELVVFTTHEPSGFAFRPYFSSTDAERARAAIKHAREVCLPDPAMRERWMRRLEMARVYMLNYKGKLAKLANGRMLDFKLIRIAIQRWGERYGHS
jgi:hypothetical protein